MSRDGSGTYNLPEAPFVFDTVISETAMNSNLSDIATALSGSIAADGQTPITADIPLGTHHLTEVNAGSASTDSANLAQIQGGALVYAGTAGGTKNALTLSLSPAITAYTLPLNLAFKAGATESDDAVTIAVNGLATKAAEIDDTALSASLVIEANKYYSAFYDGTAFQLTRLSSDVGGAFITASSTDTLTNKTIDADGTGNALSNIDIGNAIAASQAEAEAGTDNTKLLTSLRVAQAIAALAPAGGQLVNRWYAETGAVATGSTAIPVDDTIPQNTEGDQYLTVTTDTLANSANRLRITVLMHLTHSVADTTVMALFRDSVASALAVSYSATSAVANNRVPTVLQYEYAPGATTAVAFKVRAGGGGAGATTTVNGNGGSRLFGGALISSIVVEEVLP